MKPRFFVTNPCYWVLTAVSLLFLQSHCKVFKEDIDKNVILITLDTLRADYVSAYDPKHAHTPHIDYFAKNGILFKNCYSPIPITAPAHAVIFTPNPLLCSRSITMARFSEKAGRQYLCLSSSINTVIKPLPLFL